MDVFRDIRKGSYGFRLDTVSLGREDILKQEGLGYKKSVPDKARFGILLSYVGHVQDSDSSRRLTVTCSMRVVDIRVTVNLRPAISNVSPSAGRASV